MRVTVVLPTYNERENIARIVPAILTQDPGLELLIVDDNSPDGTGAIADELARAHPRVQVLHRTTKDGLGKAYLAGFRWALAHGAECIIEMDADFSHDPADLSRLLAPVRAGQADLTLGSRWTRGGGTINWPAHRKLISRGGSFYARTILGVSIRDLMGGFKCFHRRVLEMIAFESIQSNGDGFQIELTYRVVQAGFRVREVPIMFTERLYGQSKMSNAIVGEAMQMVWRLRRDGSRPMGGARHTTAPAIAYLEPVPSEAEAPHLHAASVDIAEEPLLAREVGEQYDHGFYPVNHYLAAAHGPGAVFCRPDAVRMGRYKQT